MAYEELKQAYELIKAGDKQRASTILVELIKREPKNEYAWLYLAFIMKTRERKLFCLQQVVKINPNNFIAIYELETIETKSTSDLETDAAHHDSTGAKTPLKTAREFHDTEIPASHTKTSPNVTSETAVGGCFPKGFLALIGFLLVIIAVIVILVKITNLPSDPNSVLYKPNSSDAYKEVLGYSLNLMAAGHTGNYWHCGPEDAYEFYKIKVDYLQNDAFYVIGATKAVNRYCVYDISYFYTTIKYNRDSREWQLVDKITFSNRCVTTEPKDGECISSQWRYGWKPDPNWRP